MVRKEFLDRLNELMKANDTNKYRLSKDAGLGDATVQSWYTSPNVLRPTTDSINAIALVLRTDAEELKRLAGHVELQPVQPNADPILLRLLVDRLRELDKLDPDYARFIQEMALYMLEFRRHANGSLDAEDSPIEPQHNDNEAVLSSSAAAAPAHGDNAPGLDRQPPRRRRYASPGAEAAATTRRAARLAVRARLLESL